MRAYIVGIIILSIIVVILVVIILKKRKRIKEDEYNAIRKRQDTIIKAAISNPYIDNIATSNSSHQPYNVKYKGMGMQKEDNNRKRPLAQIIEKTEISEKKYLFEAVDRILICDQYGKAKISNGTDSEKIICEILYLHDAYCVKPYISDFEIFLVRGKKRLKLNQDIIKLKTRDCIIVNRSIFSIEIISL